MSTLRSDTRPDDRIASARLMKRKAVITVEYEVEDYVGAKAQESRIRRALVDLSPDFDRIDIRFADRRPRNTPRAPAPDRSWPRD
ncbi:hypothetical protein [Brevundimonas sp.]|uniref:hypothetical protein n=1 Tax=Brevundimonas sp. TaxID=1871086 RepID=UPI002FC68567